MDLTSNEWVVVALLCTVSLLIGWISGSREKRIDEEIADGEAWAQHYASVRWVTRRAEPVPDETVAF